MRAQALRKQRLKMREEHGGPLREGEELTEHIEGLLSDDEVRFVLLLPVNKNDMISLACYLG